MAKTINDVVLMVSYYRTGKHWLSMLMELYFGGPVLPDCFYDRSAPMVAHHTHATGEEVNILPAPQTIYLYRDPVDTIFSQSFKQHNRWNFDEYQITRHARRYGEHLATWLHPERVSCLTLIRYECMQADFPRICALYGQECDQERLGRVFAQATKKEMTQRVRAPRAKLWVTRTDREYARARNVFRGQFAGLVWRVVLDRRSWLLPHFDYLRGWE